MSIKKILIVDDSADIRNLLTLALKNDYDLKMVENGIQAFEQVSMNQYDLLITDYEMPGMDGLQLTKKIMTHYPGLPVIIMTGNEESIPMLRMAGAQACLKKPLNFVRLKLLIQNILSQKKPIPSG